jgi:STE24 endopeptidase
MRLFFLSRARAHLLLLLLALFLTLTAGRTQAAPAQLNSAQSSDSSSSNTPAQNSTATYRLSPEKYQKAVAYSRAGYRLYFLSVFLDLAILLLLLHSGFIFRLRNFAEVRASNRILQSLIFVPALFALLALLHLPIRLYSHHLSLLYQQSIESWGPWLWDWTKAQLLLIAIALPVVNLLFTLIRTKPRAWWLYAWLGAIPLSLFLVFIAPWYIDPLFNKFSPLQQTHPHLVDSIVSLTYAAGHPIPRSNMFLMEASAKTNAVNAYVTGLGASKRIVIWDTSIQKTKPDELLFIVGHEMGHYVLGHVVKGFAFFLALLFVALFLAYRLLQWLITRFGATWGIREQSDWVALGALLLILNIFSFFGEPIGNAFSRMQEHAADVYSLQLLQGMIPAANEVAAHSFQVLGEEDLADPHPSKFITFWLYSHPPLNDRLRFAHDFPNHHK